MTFISYAQNYEDVMLYRALKHIKEGVYIDVGANDPVVDSVTKAFYERGWRGINIEPVRQWYDKLISDRPQDMNLNIAISSESGTVSLYEVEDTGLSTFYKDLAVQHRKKRGFQFREILVPALTLDDVLKNSNHGEVHFLKIDVEGAEQQVLKSINLEKIRPWIILVEATTPSSQQEDYKDWEPLLTEHGYVFVYFDGLNRFYLAQEREKLAQAFSAPPNVFDEFIPVNQWKVQMRLDNQEAERRQLEEILSVREAERQQIENALSKKEQQRLQLENELRFVRERVKTLENDYSEQKKESQHWSSEANRLYNELQSVYQSTSWKSTYPLRLLGSFARWFYHGSVAWLTFAPNSRPRRLAKSVLLFLKQKINANRAIRSKAMKILSRFPAIENRLRRVGHTAYSSPVDSQSQLKAKNEDHKKLTLRARKIYFALDSAIKKNKEVR